MATAAEHHAAAQPVRATPSHLFILLSIGGAPETDCLSQNGYDASGINGTSAHDHAPSISKERTPYDYGTCCATSISLLVS